MLRRDFFKAMTAAATALVAGSTALARPKAVVSANTAARASLPPPAQATDDTLAFVRSVLKECRVIGHETSMRAGELTRCLVRYRHDPRGRQTADDREWEKYLADAKIVSVNVTTSLDEVDVSHLGEGPFGKIGSLIKPVSDVEIEYIFVSKRGHA